MISKKTLIICSVLALLAVIVYTTALLSLSKQTENILKQANVLTSLNQKKTYGPLASTEDLAKANNMVALKEGEFAVIKNEFGTSTGKKVTTALTLSDGSIYTVETDKAMTVQLIEGKAGVDIFVPANNSNVEIHQIDDFDGYDGKVDKAVNRKLKKQEIVPVIIQFNLSTKKYYDPNDTSTTRTNKKNEFKNTKDEINNIITKGKGKQKGELQIINGISADVDLDTLNKLSKHSKVKSIELDRVAHVFLDESLDEIKAKDVWNLFDVNGNSITGVGKTIAIIDTGVDYTHTDLGGCFGPTCKVIGGYDFVNNDSNPMDDHGHGTHVAATAAGNGLLKGVAPDAKILAYKVLNSGGSGSYSAIISAVQRATDPNQDGNSADHVDVASMSLGGGGNPDDSQSLAVDNSSAAGVVHTISAGNSGRSGPSTIGSPGTARTAITIAAACKASQIGVLTPTCTTAIADFSSRGPLIWNGVDIKKPDVAAPGVMICAARWDSYGGTTCFDSQHHRISGTSMAAPHVAGAAALVRQAYPSYTPEQVKNTLKSTAKNLGLSYDFQGAGEIDLKAAIPISPKVTATPPYWNITSDPIRKTNSFQQSFSVTPLVADINTLTVSFQVNLSGVTISSNKTTLQVVNKTTDTFQATLNIDNDIAKAGTYSGSILLKESDVLKGVIPITITVKPTITVQPSSIDYGVDDPGLSSWTSDVKSVTVTNIRTDVAQTLGISSTAYPTSVTYQGPSSVTVAAGSSTTVNSTLHVDNTNLANNTYNGMLNLINTANTINIATKFNKFYVLIVQDADGSMKSGDIWIHNRNSTGYYKGGSFPITFYLNSLGTYDAMAWLPYTIDSTSTSFYRYFDIKENIVVNQKITTISVSKSEVKNQVKMTATDSNGINQSPLGFYVAAFEYLPNSSFAIGFYTMTPSYNNSINYFSNFSTNYRFTIRYPWPSYLPAAKKYFFYGEATGLQNNINFTNTPSDFKTMDMQYDVDQQSGGIMANIYSCMKNWSCLSAYTTGQTLPLPLTQTIYSLIPSDNAHFYCETSYNRTPYFSIGDSYQRWWSTTRPTSYGFLPFSEKKIYNGLGPSYWTARFKISPTLVILYTYNDAPGYDSIFTILRQDYSFKEYPAFKYGVYQNNILVASSTIPAAAIPVPFGDGQNVPISWVNLPKAGLSEFRASFPYKNKGLDMTGSVLTSFDTSLADPNPPTISRLYYFANNARSEVYDKAYTNRIEFDLDPIGGTMTTGAASYSLDGINFTPLTVSGTNGIYTANVPSGLAVGSIITLKIQGTDNSNNSLSYTFQLPVGGAPPPPDTTPPTVSITSPPSGTPPYTSAQTVTITATATDDVGVTRVDFYDGQTQKGTDDTPPYNYNWSFTSADNGTHSWTAKAYDAAGNVGTSSALPLTVAITPDTTPPTVSMTSPTNGSTVSGNVTVSANASDDKAVAKVEFYRDSGIQIGTDNSYPYSITWNSTSTTNGSHTLYAKAYDTSNNTAISATVSVTVSNGTQDTTPPTVSITSPSNGTTFNTATTVAINVTATDNVGVTKVDFYDGQTLKGTDNLAPYTYSWSITSANNGTHTWTAKAYDLAGNVGTSNAVSLTVAISTSDTTPPTVTITSPPNGYAVQRKSSVVIAANATDNVGVTKVDFYVNNSLTCTDTAAPYYCTWSVPAPPNKSYQLQAKAYDAKGNVGTSQTVSVISSR